MGVKLNDLTNNIFREINIKSLTGKTIAIDAFNTIYQFLAIIRGFDGSPLKNLKGESTSHISGLFYRNIKLIEYNIKPVYVFDGVPNILKKEELTRRRQMKKAAVIKMNEAIDSQDFETARKYAQSTSKVNSKMIEDSKKLLNLMGISVVQANEDAESQAAYLVNNNMVYAAGSQDYDTLLFGAKRMIRNLSHNRTKKVKNTTIKIPIQWIKLEKLLESLEIDQNQLIDVGILSGVDFYPGIRGIGTKSAYELIKTHKSLDNLVENKIKSRGIDFEKVIDLEVIDKVRNIFRNPNVDKNVEIKKYRPNYDKLKEFLVEENNFDRIRIESGLSKLKSKSESKQITLGGFMR